MGSYFKLGTEVAQLFWSTFFLDKSYALFLTENGLDYFLGYYFGEPSSLSSSTELKCTHDGEPIRRSLIGEK
jgi:hypothetical protein